MNRTSQWKIENRKNGDSYYFQRQGGVREMNMNRISNTKRIIAMMVTIAMVTGNLPVSSWAALEVGYDNPKIIPQSSLPFTKPAIDIAKYDLDKDGKVTIEELEGIKARVESRMGESHAEEPLEGDITNDGRV